MRIIDIFKEIGNYYFVKKVIRKNKNTPEWVKNNLRVGYFGVIYTVINLPPEVFEGEEIYYQVYIVEKMKPINDYLASLNLAEIITPSVSPLTNREVGQYAYLIKYVPLFREFTLWWVASRAAVIGCIGWMQFKFNIFGGIYKYIEIFYNWITTSAH